MGFDSAIVFFIMECSLKFIIKHVTELNLLKSHIIYTYLLAMSTMSSSLSLETETILLGKAKVNNCSRGGKQTCLRSNSQYIDVLCVTLAISVVP